LFGTGTTLQFGAGRGFVNRSKQESGGGGKREYSSPEKENGGAQGSRGGMHEDDVEYAPRDTGQRVRGGGDEGRGRGEKNVGDDNCGNPGVSAADAERAGRKGMKQKDA